MPICDGYKATHLLRHHGPYKSYVRDVPIVAMTASAIQGDQEKCRRAGMDDYLAKPVKAKTLERMLVRWSLDKRTTPELSHNSSELSDCSNGSEDCNNADIPGVGVEDEQPANSGSTCNDAAASEVGDDYDDESTPGCADPQLDAASLRMSASRSNIPTPRPTTSSEPPFFPVISQHLDPNRSPSSPGKPEMQMARPVFTDELAQQSRDDKLIDAAGGAVVSPLAHTPLAEKGDSLTEANVQKFQREELRRRLTSEDGIR